MYDNLLQIMKETQLDALKSGIMLSSLEIKSFVFSNLGCWQTRSFNNNKKEEKRREEKKREEKRRENTAKSEVKWLQNYFRYFWKSISTSLDIIASRRNNAVDSWRNQLSSWYSKCFEQSSRAASMSVSEVSHWGISLYHSWFRREIREASTCLNLSSV